MTYISGCDLLTYFPQILLNFPRLFLCLLLGACEPAPLLPAEDGLEALGFRRRQELGAFRVQTSARFPVKIMSSQFNTSILAFFMHKI